MLLLRVEDASEPPLLRCDLGGMRAISRSIASACCFTNA
jgi:hypothetical protein